MCLYFLGCYTSWDATLARRVPPRFNFKLEHRSLQLQAVSMPAAVVFILAKAMAGSTVLVLCLCEEKEHSELPDKMLFVRPLKSAFHKVQSAKFTC